MRTVAKKKTDVAVRPETKVPAVQDPERFRRFGNIGITDMEIPALRLLHGLSKR